MWSLIEILTYMILVVHNVLTSNFNAPQHVVHQKELVLRGQATVATCQRFLDYKEFSLKINLFLKFICQNFFTFLFQNLPTFFDESVLPKLLVSMQPLASRLLNPDILKNAISEKHSEAKHLKRNIVLFIETVSSTQHSTIVLKRYFRLLLIICKKNQEYGKK